MDIIFIKSAKVNYLKICSIRLSLKIQFLKILRKIENITYLKNSTLGRNNTLDFIFIEYI